MAHQLFPEGPRWVSLGRAPKACAEKVYMLFLSLTNLLFAKPWGQKGYSREFVFPRFWRSSGELFGVNSYQNPLFFILCVEGLNCSENSWKVFG